MLIKTSCTSSLVGTYEHSEGHDRNPTNHGRSSSKFVDDQHFDDCAADLQCRLDSTHKERKLMPKSELVKERRQVIFHGCGAAHLRHKLEQGCSPKPVEEVALGK